VAKKTKEAFLAKLESMTPSQHFAVARLSLEQAWKSARKLGCTSDDDIFFVSLSELMRLCEKNIFPLESLQAASAQPVSDTAVKE